MTTYTCEAAIRLGYIVEAASQLEAAGIARVMAEQGARPAYQLGVEVEVLNNSEGM